MTSIKIEDKLLTFHNYKDDCPGLIISGPNGTLICHECKEQVGKVDSGVMQELLARVQ